MGFRIALWGKTNSGKSYGRITIRDGENVMIVAASLKATYLTDSNNMPVGMLDIKGKQFNGWEEAKAVLGVLTNRGVINKLYDYAPGTMQRANLPGNMVLVKNLAHIKEWLTFIDKHMPWIHTIILPDFTHYISEIISEQTFIDRKIGGEAFQKFWEMAAESLRNFVTVTDHVSNNTIIICEYHAEFNPEQNVYELFTSGGKMLKEKFLPNSYYDILLGTMVKYHPETEEAISYHYVTRQTLKYPDIRSMGILGQDLLIPNDLQFVLDRIRETQRIPIREYHEPGTNHIE